MPYPLSQAVATPQPGECPATSMQHLHAGVPQLVGMYSPHRWHPWSTWLWCQGIVSLGPKGHLLYEATPLLREKVFHLIHRNKTENQGKWGDRENIPNERTSFNETEICNPYKEFKVMVVKILTELGRQMDEYSEYSNRAIENLTKIKQKSQSWRI